MKRWRWHLLVLLLLVVVGGLIIFISGMGTSPAPFRPFKPSDLDGIKPWAYIELYYGDISNGLVWIHSTDPTTSQGLALLFNIESETILGVLDDAFPEYYDSATSIGIYSTREPTPVRSLPPLIHITLDILGLIDPVDPDEETLIFHSLMADGKSRPLGSSWAQHGVLTRRYRSPDGRYLLTRTTDGAHHAFDLKSPSIIRMKIDRGHIGGWWSNEEFLIANMDRDLVLYNVRKKTSEVVMTFADILRFAHDNGLNLGASDYYTLMGTSGPDGGQMFIRNGWLAKLGKAKEELVLISRAFPFGGTGSLNADGSLYAGSGRSGSDTVSGVYLHDVASSQTTTLVAPDRSKRYFSSPRFYGDTIIYTQDGKLCSINIDGSNQRVLFDPTTYTTKP